MVNQTKFIVKGHFIKNNIGSPTLSDFLLIRALRIIESAEALRGRNNTICDYSSVRGLLKVDTSKLGVIQTNNLIFSNFNMKFLARKPVLYKFSFNKLFWYNLINLSFFSNSLVFRKRYIGFPKKKRLIFTSRTWLKSNTQIDSYLSGGMNLKFIGSTPFILRNARSQFRNYELQQNLYRKVSDLVKSIKINNHILPVFYNFFFTRFLGNLFYPYYEFRGLGANRSLTEKIFCTTLYGVSYFFKKPLALIVGHSEVLQKYYKLPVDNNLFFFENNSYSCMYILIYLYCTEKDIYARLMQDCGCFNFSENSTFFILGHSSVDTREFFETRVALWENDAAVENEVSKFFATNVGNLFPYFRKLSRLWWIIMLYSNTNYSNFFLKSWVRNSQFFLFKGGLSRVTVAANKWTWVLCAQFVGKPVVKPPVWLWKYYSYNNLVRPTFLFLFLLNYLVQGITKVNFKLFFGWLVLGNFLYYLTPQVGRIFNLITINRISKINLEFFWKNWDYSYNIFRKWWMRVIIFIRFFKFVFNSLHFCFFSNKWNYPQFFLYALLPILVYLAYIVVYSATLLLLGLFGLLLLLIVARVVYVGNVKVESVGILDKRYWYFLFFRVKLVLTDLRILLYTLAFFNLTSLLFLNVLWVTGFFIVILRKIKFIKLYLLQLKSLWSSSVWSRLFTKWSNLSLKFITTDVLPLSVFYYFSFFFSKNLKIEFLWVVWVNPPILQIGWFIKSYIYEIFANVGWWLNSNSFKFNTSDYLVKYFINYLYKTVFVYGQLTATVPTRNFSGLWRLLILMVELCWISGFLSYYEYAGIITWLGEFYKSSGFSNKFLWFMRDVIVSVGVGSHLMKFSYIEFRRQSFGTYLKETNSGLILPLTKKLRFFFPLISFAGVMFVLAIFMYNVGVRTLQWFAFAFYHFYLLGK